MEILGPVNGPLDAARLSDVQSGGGGITDSGQIMGYVNHGADANAVRPDIDGAVLWDGSVQPVNMLAGDYWVSDDVTGGGSANPLLMRGNQVKVLYLSAGPAGAGWYLPGDSSRVDLTGRLASITWEGTADQIPAQGTGVADFRIGDTALIRDTTLESQPTNDPDPEPTDPTDPTPESPDYMSHGLIVSKTDLDAQPMSDSAWTTMLSEADKDDHATLTDFLDNNGDFNTQTLAKAIVYARMKGNVADATADAYRASVETRLADFVSWDISGATSQALGRNIGALAIAADMINLGSLNSGLDASFRTKIADAMTQWDSSGTDGFSSVVDGSLRRPNNHGTVCRFTLTAVYLYLGDTAGIDTNVIPPLRRWLGDTSYHNGSNIGTNAFAWNSEQSWQANPSDASTWVGVNPAGTTKDGHNFDGLQPEDQRRGSPANYVSTDFPNTMTPGYIWLVGHETLWTLLLLERGGYSGARYWSDSAGRRIVDALYRLESLPDAAAKGYDKITTGSDKCLSGPTCNFLYGTNHTEVQPANSWSWWASGSGFDHFLFQGRTF